MASLGLLKFSALTLCVLVSIRDSVAQASSGVFFGRKGSALELPSIGQGLCASSLTIHGYKCQELEITTKDGYILSLQRIPEGRSGNVTKKQPVIVQHGVLVDGTTWVLNTPDQNLPMILADSGFDVWIANARGTRYSTKHTSKNIKNKDYWDWTWDDLVTYELPAIFDYVFSQTGQKAHYVGHSMGTLVALGYLAEGKPVNHLKSVALLSPVAYLSHMTTSLGQAAARSLFGETVTVMGIDEFNLRSLPVVSYIKGICARPGVNCNDMFTALTGENCCLESSAFDLFMKTEPQPSSTKNLMQLAQCVRTGYVAKYDYERPELNLLHYGQLTPPKYNFSNIPRDFPIFMSYGGRDALSDVEDVKILLNDLKSHDADKLTVQYIKNYAHADYIMAINARDLVYNAIIEFFRKF